MSLAGPRLDRPSAIGDEGRPRAASLWLASLVVVAVVGVVGVVIGVPSLLPTLGLVVGLSVAGVGLLERNGLASQFVAHTFLLTFGSAFALVVLAAPLVSRVGLAVSGCALALAGIGAAWADLGDDDLQPAAMGSVIGYASMLCSAVVVTILAVAAVFGAGVIAEITGVSSPIASLIGFCMILAVTGTVVRLALGWLPVREVTPRDRRPAVERRLAVLQQRLLYGIVGSIGAIIGVSILALAVGDGRLPAGSLLAGIFGALSSPVVVWPLVAIGAVSGCLGVGALLLRRLTREVTAETTRRTGAVVAGVGLSLPFVFGLALFLATGGVVVGPVVIGAAILVALAVGPLAVMFLLGGGLVGIALGLVPTRATGPAIAATGLIVTAIGLGRARPLLVFACIAAAILVWDSSTFGLGLTAELGHLPETRRLELFHAAVAVGVAVAAVALAIGLEGLRSLVASGGAAGPTALIVFGAVLLLLPLRG